MSELIELLPTAVAIAAGTAVVITAVVMAVIAWEEKR